MGLGVACYLICLCGYETGCLLDVIGVCSVVELDLIFTVLEEFYILRLELYVKRKVIILICCVLSLQSFDAISLF
jgi:hypothetical protein